MDVRTRSDGEISDGSKEIGTDLFGQTKRPISERTKGALWAIARESKNRLLKIKLN